MPHKKDKELHHFCRTVNPIMDSVCICYLRKMPAKALSKPILQDSLTRIQCQYQDKISHSSMAQSHNLSRLRKMEHNKVLHFLPVRMFLHTKKKKKAALVTDGSFSLKSQKELMAE